MNITAIENVSIDEILSANSELKAESYEQNKETLRAMCAERNIETFENRKVRALSVDELKSALITHDYRQYLAMQAELSKEETTSVETEQSTENAQITTETTSEVSVVATEVEKAFSYLDTEIKSLVSATEQDKHIALSRLTARKSIENGWSIVVLTNSVRVYFERELKFTCARLNQANLFLTRNAKARTIDACYTVKRNEKDDRHYVYLNNEAVNERNEVVTEFSDAHASKKYKNDTFNLIDTKMSQSSTVTLSTENKLYLKQVELENPRPSLRKEASETSSERTEERDFNFSNGFSCRARSLTQAKKMLVESIAVVE